MFFRIRSRILGDFDFLRKESGILNKRVKLLACQDASLPLVEDGFQRGRDIEKGFNITVSCEQAAL